MTRTRKAGPQQTQAAASTSVAEGRLLVATLGHVDHGKTSLLRALTGTDTDRLPDEKRRGISIELGYAELPDHPLSFIDVPGHKKLVHTMIAGLGGVDVGLLVVAADDGVMPQTREHLQICRLTGMERLVVALSKADLVDDEMRSLAALDVQATLKELGFEDAPIIPTDTQSGKGLSELADALTAVRSRRDASEPKLPTWLAIDRVFSVKGAGTVVTGTLTRGQMELDRPLTLLGSGGSRQVRCRSLEVHGRDVSRATAPCRVALNLALSRGQEVERGDALTDGLFGAESKRIDVTLRVLEEALPELEDGASVLCHIGTSYRQGRLTWFEQPSPEATGYIRGVAHLAFASPMPVQPGVPLVLRGFRTAKSRGSVLAGGVVLDVHAAALPRRKSRIRGGNTSLWHHRKSALEALRDQKLGDACEHWLLYGAPRSAALESLASRSGCSVDRLSRAIQKHPRLLILAEAVTTKHSLEVLSQSIVDEVRAHHATAPHELGMPREAALARLSRLAGRAVAERVLRQACDDSQLSEVAQRLATPEFLRTGSASLTRNREQVGKLLGERGLQGASERELWTELSMAPQALKSVLSELARQGLAVSLSELWFPADALEALKASVLARFEGHPTLSVGDLKDLAGVSRKQAVPLMEYLDRARVTRRVGNDRVPYGT
ncbi:MAG: selenocysteine-specific translation elongation factor [Polyangiaceae bacterium]|nr:selenocysteine-specific translation elongation factor [Myxococcales bacterium]MCB9588963.1 selenocysteine-specific translation elongation factor [Polyangiaceae bacterium]MCB9609259.1 selenocysteine-specific translation elongation factor [Polyangiaceae bacterium]